MGILNCTPDSYFEESRHTDPDSALQHALRLFDEGADIVDIGGESTNPKTLHAIDEEEELHRVIPVIKKIREITQKPISIDTFKVNVARKALEAGANLLNDITGFSDPEMCRLAAESRAPICVMHMLGKPFQHVEPFYKKGVIVEILEFFERRIDTLLNHGVSSSQIIIDPGIGGGSFGKSIEQSFQIIKHIKKFQALGFPILIGVSRKSFLQKFLQKPASELLSTTLALNTIAILEEVDYIRVHDVAAHRDIVTVLGRLRDVE